MNETGEACALCAQTIFIWKADGDPHTGPLTQYARMYEESRHGGAFRLSDTVLTWGAADRDPVTWDVKITREPGLTEDDHILYLIEVPGLPDATWARVDARS